MGNNDLATYTGSGRAILTHGGTEAVSFVLRQLGNGHLIGSCEMESGYITYGDVVRIEGATADGWAVACECPLHDAESRPWHMLEFSPQTIAATRQGDGAVSLAKVSGPLLNLRFPRPHQWWNRQLSWCSNDLDISVIETYESRIEQLEETNGIMKTATLSTDMPTNLSIEELWKQLAAISSPLSLATGHLVSLAGLCGEDANGKDLVRFHADVITHPFRTHAAGFGVTTNPRKLVIAWNTQASTILPRELIRRHIWQYLDAITSTLFLDSRAMLSVCFLDAFSSEYCKARYNKKPYLQKRLETMVNDLKIDITTTPEICEVVKESRHNLVHEGKFVSTTGGPDRVWETIQAHWLSFAFLTRLIDPQIGIRPIYDIRTQAGAFNPVSDYDL